MSAEPTAEQVQAAQELHECHRDRYIGDNHYRCVVHETIWPCDVAVTTARALAAAVTAEREKYLRVAKECDVEAARERQYFTQRLDEGNEPASLVCTGMSIGWEHAARRIRGVTT